MDERESGRVSLEVRFDGGAERRECDAAIAAYVDGGTVGVMGQGWADDRDRVCMVMLLCAAVVRELDMPRDAAVRAMVGACAVAAANADEMLEGDAAARRAISELAAELGMEAV